MTNEGPTSISFNSNSSLNTYMNSILSYDKILLFLLNIIFNSLHKQ